MKNNPIVVFVTDDEQSQAAMQDSNLLIFAAQTTRDALAQVVFSYPDIIVIDARDDMLRAEDVYFHLRSIEHPPVVILSDMPQRWDTSRSQRITVLPEDSNMQTIITAMYALLGRKRTIA